MAPVFIKAAALMESVVAHVCVLQLMTLGFSHLLGMRHAWAMAIISLLHMVTAVSNATSMLWLMLPALSPVTGDDSASVTIVV